jgi:hypothetical protein
MFTHPVEPFTAVQWTGSNLDEITAYLGFSPAVISGLLTVPAAGGEIAVVQVGWWVHKDAQGLGVASAAVAARWVPAQGE